ncbi:MAG: DUF58 domain-containing protein [candidate division Zixibacteria bacterium 4484_95]|nr:MAG: DUF58 domain-containing protein [candidate division Zixibacteria bacterium 4484_95]
MPEDYRRYLDPKVVSKLAGMELKARLVVEGFIVGLHRSPYHGFSVEFAEHRQYMPGDDVKHIDWKVYGKSDRFYIKQFEEETNLRGYILLDASASMGYKSNGVSKFEYGSYFAAALSYLMLRQQDAPGLLIYDQQIRAYIPPRGARSHINNILKQLEKTQPSSKTDAAIAFHELAERIKRRGLIVVISDLFDDPDRMLAGLKHFRHRKHEVIVFQVLDPFERNFGYRAEARFRDMETGQMLLTNPYQIRKEYIERLDDFIEKFSRACRDALIDYHLLDTSVPFDKALFGYLAKRSKLG